MGGSPPPHSYFGVPPMNHCGVPPSRGWMPHSYDMQQSPLRHPSLSECINDAAASAHDCRTGHGRRGFGSVEVGEARGDHVDPKMASPSCFQGKATGASIRIRGRGSGHLEVDGKFEAPTPLMWAVTADYEDAEGFRNAVEMTLAELRTVEHRFLVFCQKKGHVQEGPCFS